MDIPDICYQTNTKALRSLSKEHQNLILSFIIYFEYIINYNNPIGDEWVQIISDDFNKFHIMDHHNLNRLYKIIIYLSIS